MCLAVVASGCRLPVGAVAKRFDECIHKNPIIAIAELALAK